jgi:23S rRNA (uracil1939-C5)-methyltransferase
MPGPERFELRIDSLVAGGDGIGRAPDGQVVFVPFTAPGDRVVVDVTRRRPRFLRGVARELIEAGPGRTDPLCPVFGRCGGCTWQHLDYDTQLEAKRTIVADAIERIAGLPVPEGFVVIPSPKIYGYRGRARVVAERGRVGFRRRHAHAVCPTRRCPVLVPELDDSLAKLAENPPRSSGEWEIAVGTDGAASCAALPVRDSSAGIRVVVAGERLHVSAGSFVQANPMLREALLGVVTDAAGSGENLLELHAGVGFFTLPLARRFLRVIAVEANPLAVADLEENVGASGLDNVEIAAEPAERVLEDWRVARRVPEGWRGVTRVPDVVVLDPPRTGLEREGCDALGRLGAARIVYVSCDPATLSRDAGVLGDRGYRLTALTALDLFPQTPHVEAVAVLER